MLFFNAICAKQSDGEQGKNIRQGSLLLLAEEQSKATNYMRLWKPLGQILLEGAVARRSPDISFDFAANPSIGVPVIDGRLTRSLP